MASAYAQVYGEKLAASMQARRRNDAQAYNPVEALHLGEEALCQKIIAYQWYIDKAENEPNEAAAVKIRMMAAEILTEAVAQAIKLKQEAARIETGSEHYISMTQIAQHITRFMQVVERFVPDPIQQAEAAKQIEDAFNTINAVATTVKITPERVEADVRAMHSTIPDVPEEIRVA